MTETTTTTAPPPLTLHDAVDRYKEQRWPELVRVQNQCYKDHKSRLKLFIANAADTSLATLTLENASDLIQAFIDSQRERKRGDTTLSNHRVCLSAMFAWFIRQRWVTFKVNPAGTSFINCPRPLRRCRPPVSDKDLQTLLKVAKESSFYPQLLLCLSGLRPVGASRVRLEHMDFESKTLRVSEKRRERIVPLSNWMLDEFKEWLAVKPWPEWRRDTLYHRLRKLCDAAGLPAHVTLQALRRTFLKRMLDAGVPIANCAAIAGNSPGVISKHYVELSTLDSHKYVNVLNFASGSAAKPAPEPVKPKPQKLASFLQRRQS